jgi:hypothetical protein
VHPTEWQAPVETRDAFVLLFSVAATAVVLLSALVVLPACSASVFRHWLWEMHDEVVSAVREKEVPSDDDVHDFLRRLHVLIATTNDYRMLNLVLTYVAARSVHGRSEPMPTLGETLNPQVLAWESRVTSRSSRYLVFGSPSGWILTPLLFIAAITWAIVRTVQSYRPTRTAITDRMIRLELGQVPDLLEATSGHRDADMSHPCLV